MMSRLLARCGYRNPDDLADFLMTGVAVVPLVVFLGCGFDEAFGLLLLMLLTVLGTIPWVHAQGEVRRREEEAQAAAQAAYLRQITGKDR